MGLFRSKKKDESPDVPPGATLHTKRTSVIDALEETAEGETIKLVTADGYEGEHRVESNDGDVIKLDSDAGGRTINLDSGTVRDGGGVGFGILKLIVWR